MPQQHSTGSQKLTTPTLITVEDVANLMQVSTRTIWRLLSAGKIPTPLRIGKSVRWRTNQIENWIEAGCPDE